ncbi:RsfA family transcriptional regulator [Sutcliffiella deserti]|uniref:RsfA family transcriptional regulator n=1 Tax=Sutcliffiella deserti TaxID=2875501 RepID=UPI001CBB8FB8|nr:RsfA family transcriptional regulator [Sutcliffiella deserti]
MKVRQDAWSHEDDLLLAETVLRYIRDGGTQLAAFEEVGDKLNRTSAACGFRWNAEVRKKYEPTVAIAKKQRKERKRALDKQKKEQQAAAQPLQRTKPQLQLEWLPAPATSSLPLHKTNADSYHLEVGEETSYEPLPQNKDSITLDDCIQYLQTYKRELQSEQGLKLENERLLQENVMLKRKQQALKEQLRKMEEQQSIINDDYEMLVQIMDRARKMTALHDEVM